MKKGLSKLLGITLLCATIISGGALISHLALSRNAENNVVQNNNNNNQSSKLVSAKHKFLIASYDFRNQVNSLRKFKNNDENDMRSLMNFINGSNRNLHDEDSPLNGGFLGDFNSYQHQVLDENTLATSIETVYSYQNVYKGNGGLRIGTDSGENDSNISIGFVSDYSDDGFTSVKIHCTTYNTIINGVDHYDEVVLNGGTTIIGDSVLEFYNWRLFELFVSKGRLIIYQLDFYFDYCNYYDVLDIDNVPKGVGYSYESVGSFKYGNVFGQDTNLLFDKSNNALVVFNSLEMEEAFNEDDYDLIIQHNDGDYNLPLSYTFEYLVILKDYNFVIGEFLGNGFCYLPSSDKNLFINENSEFFVFRKVTSLDPHGPQY